MALQTRLKKVASIALMIDGGIRGEVKTSSSCSFKLNQIVVLKATGLEPLTLKVMRVPSEFIVELGPVKGNTKDRTDVSAYTIALNATIEANEQERPAVPEQEIERHTFEDEPTVARRSFLVDCKGDGYTKANPIPAEISDGENSQKITKLSTDNSTSALLGIGGTFTGPWEDILGWNTISVLSFADQDSATDGFRFEVSSDGVNVDNIDVYTMGANDGKSFSFAVVARFFRVVYTNGSVAQTEFRLQTILHNSAPKYSSHRIGDTFNGDNDAQLVEAVNCGEDPNEVFTGFRRHGLFEQATTTTPLGAAGVFTSPIMDLTDFTHIASSIRSDQPGVLVGEWFADAAGTQLVRTFTAPYTMINEDVFQGTARLANYLRVTYTNGSVAQTTFSFLFWHNTEQSGGQVSSLEAFLPANIITSINRSVLTGKDPNGVYQNVLTTRFANLKITPSDSETGAEAIVTQTNSLKVAQNNVLVGDAFGGAPISLNKWDVLLANGGTQSVIPGELVLDTNGVADASIRINSIDIARFLVANFNTVHFGYQLLDMGATDNVRELGAFDATNMVSQNGVFLRFNGLTIELVVVKNNIETVTPESSFNGNAAFKNDGNVHVIEIFWNAGKVELRQDNVLIHTASAQGTPFWDSPHLKVGVANYNINGGTADVQLRLRAAGAYRNGEPSQQPTSIFVPGPATTTIKQGPGKLHNFIVARTGVAGGAQTMTLYDSLTASGKVLVRITLEQNTTLPVFVGANFNIGLTAEFSSAQLEASVIWD